MIFIDASYFVAVAYKKDQWHQKSIEIHKQIKKQKQITSILTLSEALNIIGSLQGGKAGSLMYNYIRKNNEIIYINEEMSLNAMDKHLHYDGTLSFVDTMSLEVMERYGIDNIVSFDSDFDKVRAIKRIH